MTDPAPAGAEVLVDTTLVDVSRELAGHIEDAVTARLAWRGRIATTSPMLIAEVLAGDVPQPGARALVHGVGPGSPPHPTTVIELPPATGTGLAASSTALRAIAGAAIGDRVTGIPEELPTVLSFDSPPALLAPPPAIRAVLADLLAYELDSRAAFHFVGRDTPDAGWWRGARLRLRVSTLWQQGRLDVLLSAERLPGGVLIAAVTASVRPSAILANLLAIRNAAGTGVGTWPVALASVTDPVQVQGELVDAAVAADGNLLAVLTTRELSLYCRAGNAFTRAGSTPLAPAADAVFPPPRNALGSVVLWARSAAEADVLIGGHLWPKGRWLRWSGTAFAVIAALGGMPLVIDQALGGGDTGVLVAPVDATRNELSGPIERVSLSGSPAGHHGKFAVDRPFRGLLAAEGGCYRPLDARGRLAPPLVPGACSGIPLAGAGDLPNGPPALLWSGGRWSGILSTTRVRPDDAEALAFSPIQSSQVIGSPARGQVATAASSAAPAWRPLAVDGQTSFAADIISMKTLPPATWQAGRSPLLVLATAGARPRESLIYVLDLEQKEILAP
ncbi:MAG: hypothetical protein HYV63_16675 [Candidatus Schekmanbacteria bacterium]|nr:hypothetical protein [Candidatus Schekmanbacteria bacterium]